MKSTGSPMRPTKYAGKAQMMPLKDIRKYMSRLPVLRPMLKTLLRGCFFIWHKTVKLEHYDYPKLPQNAPVIYIGWHENLIALLFVCRDEIQKRGLVIVGLSSPHPDGKMFAEIYRHYGLESVYGSSRKNPTSAVKQMLSIINSGSSAIVIPDGPRGPRRELKKGVFYIARKTGAWVVPMGVAVEQCVRLKSWDKMVLPKMLWRNRAHIVWGQPIVVPPKKAKTAQDDDSMMAKVQQRAQHAMQRCTEQAEKLATAVDAPRKP